MSEDKTPPVREEEPSTRITTLDEASTEPARSRRTESTRPGRKLCYQKAVAGSLAAVLLTGCVAGSKRVPASYIPTVERVLVVPIEPPPLVLSPAMVWSLSESGEEVGIVAGTTYTPEGAAALAVVAGVLTLIKHPKKVELRTRMEESLDVWLSSDTSWVPTRVLAQMVAEELITRTEWPVVIRQQPLVLTDVKRRKATWHMENWYAPLRAWYNSNRPRFDLASLTDRDFDAVIEVALLNFEFAGDVLVIQVMIKWFDGASGELKGRSRDGAVPGIGSPEELFRDEGKDFKRLFAETGRELVRGCLDAVLEP